MLERMTSARLRGSRRGRLLAALALSGASAIAGCGGDPEAATAPGEVADRAVEPPPVSPLTGLPLKGDGPRHPVLAVKIDNSASSTPQVGLGSADMVVEELVEGGMTRLAAFYYDQVPTDVGPVRSMRATDIGIVQPLAAVLVASGGAAQTVARVEDAGIRSFDEEATGFYRDAGRSSPYNLFIELSDLAKTVRVTEAPASYLPFGGELPKGEPAAGLTASFSAGSSSTFELRDGKYHNTDTHAADGDQFAADTVLVLRVPVEDAGYLDPAGNPVPETRFTGTGPASIFHGGRVVQGTWSKDGLDAPVRLAHAGREVSLPPGKVWIGLVPAEAGGLTVTR